MILDVRELVRRLRAGETDRAIARELGLARKTVLKYRGLAKPQPEDDRGTPTTNWLPIPRKQPAPYGRNLTLSDLAMTRPPSRQQKTVSASRPPILAPQKDAGELRLRLTAYGQAPNAGEGQRPLPSHRPPH
jgi:hypothetical protein